MHHPTIRRRLSSIFSLLKTAICTSSARKNMPKGEPSIPQGLKRSPGDTSKKTMFTYELRSTTPAWRYVQSGLDRSSGGTMTTQVGLTCFADDAHSFEAVDARTGKPLRHFQTGQSVSASPMTYAVNGIQNVTIAAASDVVSFRLPREKRLFPPFLSQAPSIRNPSLCLWKSRLERPHHRPLR